MNILRRYIREPPGGYGFVGELYGATIPRQDGGSTVRYWILAIDNVGNYIFSDKYSYIVESVGPPEKPPEEGLPIWLILIPLVLLVGGVALYLTRFRR
jgi:hypothetical protein